jgi:hypothetical protein
MHWETTILPFTKKWKRCMHGVALNQHFLSEGMQERLDRWTKCVEKDGDYIGKRCYCTYSL